MSNTLNFVLASPNDAADKIDEMEKRVEALEAALRVAMEAIWNGGEWEISEWLDDMRAKQSQTFASLRAGKCGCHKCINDRGEIAMHFVVCSICGNKRCPHATDCGFGCTGSNEPGQSGSIYKDRQP